MIEYNICKRCIMDTTAIDINFDEKGNFKDFGVGEKKTIVPFWLITLAISMLFYLYISVQNDDFV